MLFFRILLQRQKLEAVALGIFAVLRWAAVAGIGAFAFSHSLHAQTSLTENQIRQMQEMAALKQSLSGWERKLGTDLLVALRASRGQRLTPSINRLTDIEKRVGTTSPSGQVSIDIQATVSDDLLSMIQLSGSVMEYSPGAGAIRARVALASLEAIAVRSDVLNIRLADIPISHAINRGKTASQGIVTHRAKEVSDILGITGAGVKIGVLSDSVDHLDALKASGDLPSNTVALPGQSGNPGSSEGTAMMEILHDVAPGADLLFATAFNGVAGFANNIRALAAAGAQIIVDDVSYLNEGVFQDGPIARAVNDVTAQGVLYFAAAGNENNLYFGTSGTWEGDFSPAFQVTGLGAIHGWGDDIANMILVAPAFPVILQWADRLGHATNDYDLYVFDSAGFLIDASVSVQDGDDDPIEAVGPSAAGSQLVIAKWSGDDVALFLQAPRGTLNYRTSGATYGHSAAENTVGVGAVYWNSARRGAAPFVGGFTNYAEPFSSDGPRRIFFHPDGSPVVPGATDFRFAAGTFQTLWKPDIAAADGVSTLTPRFSPFFGTSAAAPHVAGIAALVKSARPDLTAAEILTILKTTAIDNMTPGPDNLSASGIAEARAAVEAALAHP